MALRVFFIAAVTFPPQTLGVNGSLAKQTKSLLRSPDGSSPIKFPYQKQISCLSIECAEAHDIRCSWNSGIYSVLGMGKI